MRHTHAIVHGQRVHNRKRIVVAVFLAFANAQVKVHFRGSDKIDGLHGNPSFVVGLLG